MTRKLQRLSGCIDRGLALVAPQLAELRHYCAGLARVDACLEPSSGPASVRQARFASIRGEYLDSSDPVQQHIGGIMLRFESGLFAGGDLSLPQDNLELERFFKRPKHHQRHIHGRAHAGVRLVYQGPTLLPALDAHLRAPAPLCADELIPYLHASAPPSQLEAMARRSLMRRARSSKKRPVLLQQLEQLFFNSS